MHVTFMRNEINATRTLPKLPFPMTLRNSKSPGLALAFSLSPRLITFAASSFPLASGGAFFLIECCGVAPAGGVAPFGDAEASEEPETRPMLLTEVLAALLLPM